MDATAFWTAQTAQGDAPISSEAGKLYVLTLGLLPTSLPAFSIPDS